ncbi:DEAD/DEAH box helicase [Sulfuracidifex metallicus]|uniref:DEAD/DEAH box helicase n=1 Tax=Sulfuracidifex metallicus TaxID=47303 RepID=UPI0022736CB6|nr:DEAD/DEAH box helicase [Sulfuracidifex metallicus]MCY0849807.1 DEAD/DEAH box helicase [Sulfuracidifex metallicus]
MDWIDDFKGLLGKSLGFSMYPYQERVTEDVIASLKNSRFVVVSMPTGSGKTVVELAVAYYLIRSGHKNVIPLEPTRLLCDQMYHNFWRKVFQDVGEEYEGECSSFQHGKSLVVSTPFTASKCAPKVDSLIVDEVHHAFGDPRYSDAIFDLSPKFIVGFTALLPSSRKYKLDTRIYNKFGSPTLLTYDFKTLAEIDPSFRPPKAIADLFDSEMDGLEDLAYEAMMMGKVKGNKDTVKFLESTLYSYGKRAFCDSLERLREKVKDDHPSLQGLCTSDGPGHKARALKQVLSAYRIEDFRPVLIFTSRKATANEFEATLASIGGKVKVLTGDASKEERKEIVNEAKRGDVDVIVSTIVGEEGVDIPEAKLLIMTDVPQSPLRFYQRLGRLIRKGENEREGGIKYLVVTLTPKTPEYDNLDEAMRNLFNEGVDVSYIMEKKSGKGPVAKVIDMVEKSNGEVSFLHITHGKDISLEEYMMRTGDKRNVERNAMFYEFLTSKSKIREAGEFSDYLDRAIREGEIYYYYDVKRTGEILSKVLLGKYCGLCYGELCGKVCDVWTQKIGAIKSVTLGKKDLLRGLANIVIKEKLQEIREMLQESAESDRNEIEKMGREFSLSVAESFNKTNGALTLTLSFTAHLEDMTVYPKVKVAYYDAQNEDMKALAKLNSKAIGYKAGLIFYNCLQ